jgi:hypothetical protein
MDKISTKTPNPKCRLCWSLIKFIDWRNQGETVRHVGICDRLCELYQKIKLLKLKIMCLRASYKKKNMEFFFHPYGRQESDPGLDPEVDPELDPDFSLSNLLYTYIQ